MNDDEIRVNDGGGLLDNLGMIDSIIVDCNSLVKFLIDGKCVAFCSKIVEMVQKLSKLRGGVENDSKAKDDVIRELRKLNNDLAEGAYGVPADRENENL